MAVSTTQFNHMGGMYPLHTKADLAKRWGVEIKRLNNWEVRHDDFPPRIVGIMAGDTKVYGASDVKKYEEGRGGMGGVATHNAALGNRS